MDILKRFAIVAGALILLIVGFIIGAGFFVSPQDDLQQADIVVAVSGGETEERALEAVRVYDKGYAPRILFSGAAEDKTGPSNAAAMRQIALKAGVNASDILVEEDSVDTLDNAVQSEKIIRAQGAKRIILVTSPYHQRRTEMSFRKILGSDIEIINHSASDSSWRKSSWWRSPYTVALTLSELQKIIYVFSTKPNTASP